MEKKDSQRNNLYIHEGSVRYEGNLLVDNLILTNPDIKFISITGTLAVKGNLKVGQADVNAEEIIIVGECEAGNVRSERDIHIFGFATTTSIESFFGNIELIKPVKVAEGITAPNGKISMRTNSKYGLVHAAKGVSYN